MGLDEVTLEGSGAARQSVEMGPRASTPFEQRDHQLGRTHPLGTGALAETDRLQCLAQATDKSA